MDYLQLSKLEVFLSIHTPLFLCKVLSTEFHIVQEILTSPTYHVFKIKKRSGSYRKISAPDRRLAYIQHHINNVLQVYYAEIKPPVSFGFTRNIKNRSLPANIVQNALAHTGKKYVLNIDLKDFFPSIKAYRVKELFSSPLFNYPEAIATALTLLTTYKGELPIGAPSSPIISNFICLQLDQNLMSYCEVNDLTFTRYADDLTFSSDAPIDQYIIDEICTIIRLNRFEVNKKKIWLKTSNRKQTVTGLVVNQKVNVDRKLIRQVRAMLHDWRQNGLKHAASKHPNISHQYYEPPEIGERFKNRLKGYINFIGQVRGIDKPIYLKFKQQFNEAHQKAYTQLKLIL